MLHPPRRSRAPGCRYSRARVGACPGGKILIGWQGCRSFGGISGGASGLLPTRAGGQFSRYIGDDQGTVRTAKGGEPRQQREGACSVFFSLVCFVMLRRKMWMPPRRGICDGEPGILAVRAHHGCEDVFFLLHGRMWVECLVRFAQTCDATSLLFPS